MSATTEPTHIPAPDDVTADDHVRIWGGVAAAAGRQAVLCPPVRRTELARAYGRLRRPRFLMRYTEFERGVIFAVSVLAQTCLEAQDEADARLAGLASDAAEPLKRRILERLALSDRRPTEMADALGVSTRSVARVLERMREAQLVGREGRISDGRAKVYSLTDAGVEELEEMRRLGPVTGSVVTDEEVKAAAEAYRRSAGSTTSTPESVEDDELVAPDERIAAHHS